MPEQTDAEVTTQGNIAQTLAEEIRSLQAVQVHDVEGLLLVSRPAGRVLEDWTDRAEQRDVMPDSLREVVTFGRELSFIAYVNRFAGASTSLFLGGGSSPGQLVAVLDYHEAADKPAWNRHRALLPLTLSPQWLAWAKKQSFSQKEFAEFIEENITDLAAIEPDSSLASLASLIGVKAGTPSDVVAASRGLQISIAAEVKDAVTLGNGTSQVSFVEQQSTQSVVVPGLFAVAVPVFDGGQPYLLGLRVRYALKREGDSTRISWTLLPHQPQRIYEAARDEMVERIGQATVRPVYVGHLAK